jgi:hypothetical protein
MRLYFHLVTSRDTIQDLEGIEVTHLGQAQTESPSGKFGFLISGLG